MKRGIITCISVILACLLLGGCGLGQADGTEKGSGTDKIGPTSVKVGDLTVSLNDEMDGVKEALGEPLHYVENKSCLYDGYDKTYTYADVEIITYPMDGKEYISSVTVLTDNAVSGSGISLGSSADAITERYGEENLITGQTYIYETDTYGYSFFMDNDKKVTGIEVYVPTA